MCIYKHLACNGGSTIYIVSNNENNCNLHSTEVVTIRAREVGFDLSHPSIQLWNYRRTLGSRLETERFRWAQTDIRPIAVNIVWNEGALLPTGHRDVTCEECFPFASSNWSSERESVQNGRLCFSSPGSETINSISISQALGSFRCWLEGDNFITTLVPSDTQFEWFWRISGVWKAGERILLRT